MPVWGKNDGAREEHERRRIDRRRHGYRGVPSHVWSRPVVAGRLSDHDVSNARTLARADTR
jgi:hypothetical protein